MATDRLGRIDGTVGTVEANEGVWLFDDDDWALYALLCDPVFCAELLFEDPQNKPYAGQYHVRDHQYRLFRPQGNYNIAPCARDVGKTQSIIARACCHAFRRLGEDLLISTPQLVHLNALTKEIEKRVTEVRLLYDFLKRDGQRTGIVRTPSFQVDFLDGTRIIGRIPLLSGQGVKGQHVPDLIIDECFPAGTLVLTTEGQRPIETVAVGDSVLTHRGRWRRVTATAKRRRKTVELSGQGLPRLVCSENHPFWSRQRIGQGATFAEPRFTKAKDLAPADGYASDNQTRVGAHYWSSPTVIPSPGSPPVPEGVVVNDDFWWLAGFYMAEGCVSLRGDQVTFSVHEDEVGDVVGRLASIGLAATTCPDPNSAAARVIPKGAKDYAAWLEAHIGRIGAQKEVQPWLLGANERIRRLVLLGFIEGDGNWVTTDDRYAPGRWQTAIAHKPLALSMKLLALTLDYSVSLHWTPPREATIRGRAVASNGWYGLRGNVRSQTAARAGDKFFSIVRRSMPTGRVETLYDLTVDEDHSFVADSMVVSNSQDYPLSGWTEIFPTVMKDHMDSTGEYDFTMTFYGVHAHGQGGKFGELAKDPAYRVTTVTRLQTENWSPQEKAASAGMFGGVASPDYRRNVLGEPGQALSQFFVTSRLIACMDQAEESHYNTSVFKAQELQAEEVDAMIGKDGDVGELLDLPDGLGQQVYGGMDVGLVTDPTVIMIFAVLPDTHRKSRLQLIRMIHAWRLREKQIRKLTYRIARQYGLTLRAFGQDITGLGLPLYQAMEDDEECPTHLKEVSQGYVFNAKVPVAVDRNYVSEQGGQLVDQYGHIVEEVRDKWTGETSLVARMTMIEASTRYLRGFVDETFMLLPFHTKLIADFQGETEQRVKAMAGVRKKPNAFHMLDAARAMAMAYKQGEVSEQVYAHGGQELVLDRAVSLTTW